jgi:hypothetical protein
MGPDRCAGTFHGFIRLLVEVFRFNERTNDAAQNGQESHSCCLKGEPSPWNRYRRAGRQHTSGLASSRKALLPMACGASDEAQREARTRRTALPDTHVGRDGFLQRRPLVFEIPREKSGAVCPKAAGSFVISRRQVSETMSACITNSYDDCYRDFDRRSCWHSHEKVDARERNEEKPHSTQTHQEFVGIKSRPTVMNFRKNRKARNFANGQTEALAIFASPNLPSIVPMGAFPLTIVALGHVSRRNFDNMAS